MDILTHTLSGIAAGTVIAAFSGNGFRKKCSIIALGGLGGFLPDLDAISLWSGFDRTFGKLFSLKYSGNVIYFSKFWYSHHGFFHSLAAALMVALIAGVILLILKQTMNKNPGEGFLASLKVNFPFSLALFSGFVIHLIEDMLTPYCVWGGVRFFWPLKSYTGGTGNIWWWNNYDIFLIVLGVVVINMFVLLAGHFTKRKPGIPVLVFFFTGLILIGIQVKSRKYDFNYTGQTANFDKFEQKSKEIQKEILGKKLYHFMAQFDRKVRVNF